MKMRFGRLLLPCLAILFSGSGYANAACDTSRFPHWYFGETHKLYWHTNGGDVCTATIRPGSTTQLFNMRIVKKAAHGTAGRAGLTEIAYQPKPGFKGNDSFSFSFSGVGERSRGTTTFFVEVTVD